MSRWEIEKMSEEDMAGFVFNEKGERWKSEDNEWHVGRP